MTVFAVEGAAGCGKTEALAMRARAEGWDVVIVSGDKDLMQLVNDCVIMYDTMKDIRIGIPEVIEKFGVPPASIPDYLALVGDSADGYPGLKGWGAKSSAAVLAKFLHLEAIPADSREWFVNAANARALADTLVREREQALLFRTLATLRDDAGNRIDQLFVARLRRALKKHKKAVAGIIESPR